MLFDTNEMLVDHIHFSCFCSESVPRIPPAVCMFTHVKMFPVSQLGEVMVSMASNLMLADERVLWMAQREAMACSRIITCLQKIAVYRLATAQAFSLVSPVSNTLGLTFVAAQQLFGICRP